MKIIVAKNKHSTEYFKFTTEEEQKASVLKLFELNDNMSYYCQLDQEGIDYINAELEGVKHEVKCLEGVTLGMTTQLHLDTLKKKRDRLEKSLSEQKKEVDLYSKAKAGDPKAAYTLLKLRQDHEYERFEIEEVQ